MRIYGSTPAGQKACLHLHKLFPYFFIEYDQTLPLEIDHVASVNQAMSSNQKNQHIFNARMVRGRPFYGYYPQDKVFIKIFLIAHLLRSGSIMGRVFEVYEAHIPFILQVFLDFNLAGMAFIDLTKALFRRPLPAAIRTWGSNTYDKSQNASCDHTQIENRRWFRDKCGDDFAYWSPATTRKTTCDLEVDGDINDATNIMYNNYTPTERTAVEKKLVQSLSAIWSDEISRRKTAGMPTQFTQPVTQARRPFNIGAFAKPMAYQKLQQIIQDEARTVPMESDDDIQFNFSTPMTSQAEFDPDMLAANLHISSQNFENMPLSNSSSLSHSSDPIIQGIQIDHVPNPVARATSPIREEEFVFDDDEDDLTPAKEDIYETREEQDHQSQMEIRDIMDAQGQLPPSQFFSPNEPSWSDMPEEEAPVVAQQHQQTPEKEDESSCDSWREPAVAKRKPEDIPQMDGGKDDKSTIGRKHTRFYPVAPPPETVEETRVGPSRSRRPTLQFNKKQHHVPVTYEAPNAISTPPPPIYKVPPPINHPPPPSVVVSTPPPHPPVLKSILKSKTAPYKLPKKVTFFGLSKRRTAVDFVPNTPVQSLDTSLVNNITTTPTTTTTTTTTPPITSSITISSSSSSSSSPPCSFVPDTPVQNQPLPLPLSTISPLATPTKPSPNLSDLLLHFCDDNNLQRPSPSEEPSPPRNTEPMVEAAIIEEPESPPPPEYQPPSSIDREEEEEQEDEDDYMMIDGSPLTFAMDFDNRDTELEPSNDTKLLLEYRREKAIQGHTPAPTVPRLSKPPKINHSQISQAASSFKMTMDPMSKQGAQRITANLNQNLTLLSVEVLVCSRGDLNPDPTQDPISAIVYCCRDEGAMDEEGTNYADLCGVLLVANSVPPLGLSCPIHISSSERNLLVAFTELVRAFDADMLLGFEIQMQSIGYLIERARHIGISLCDEISRVIVPLITDGGGRKTDNYFSRELDRFGYEHSSGIAIAGRIVINVWRLLRHELTLDVYSFQAVVFAILGRRVPDYTPSTLTEWFRSTPSLQSRALTYVLDRAIANLEMLTERDMIGRTSEFARVYGIDFFSVLSRGSQFRVESMLLRLTKPDNYILISPSREQTTTQAMPQAIPLVIDPLTKMYNSPIIVLDFQSLYPSIMIAYNYCYSTCLGRVVPVDQQTRTKKFGASNIKLPRGLLAGAKSSIRIAPNEVMFVNEESRRGLFPRLLQEVLDTRIMIKRAMKKHRGNPAVYKMLDARQLGLKMMANVAYGYTAATYSGRMSCVEIADAIVQTARETLEAARNLVNNTKEWHAQVVYGDTDSLFILVPGVSKETAFEIGQKIADRVTAMNPRPVKLVLDKVYHPCLLVNKKRYVGYMYERPDQEVPVFDAKGIETVRRDTCKLVSKMMEASIRVLFDSKDLSLVRSYLARQCEKLYRERVPLRDFIFAKEVRLGQYSAHGMMPAAAQVATRMMDKDPRAEPRYGERVRYVVVCGTPNARLCDLVVTPQEFLANKKLRININYYLTKQLMPALDRVFKCT
eukprot:gene8023-9426_t